MTITKQTPLKEVKALAEACDKCGHCCNYSSGFLIEEDKKKIAEFLGIDEKKLEKDFLEEFEKFNTKRLRPKLLRKGKQYGVCVFYDKKVGCKIHSVKPLQCKLGNCKEHGEELSIWFLLNYFVDANDPESIRQYNEYLKSEGKVIPGGKLEELVPDKEKLKKILSFEILR